MSLFDIQNDVILDQEHLLYKMEKESLNII